MVRFLLGALGLYAGYRILKALLGQPSTPPKYADEDENLMIKDPVCGIYFLKNQGVSAKIGKDTLYFCSDECRDRYLGKGVA